jgi:class 3 adenylate cyclase/tetratricopeptide (TPR) repeat protein
MDDRACPSCGEANPPAARLCGVCGTSLVRDEAAGEVRREITLVTSDLKGSTALGERLDPEALREVLNRYFSVMRAVFESHGGTIEKIIGDAIVAVFGLPFRHDDDPIRALEAAAESQRALVLLNDELDQGWGVRLTVRTGVASGEVTFGRAEAGQHVLLGPPVELSGVMEQNAPSYEVLVAESTYDQVRDVVEVEAMPPVSPKNSDEQFPAYRLISVQARAEAAEAVAPVPVEGMRICPSCGDQSPDRYRYCNTCGASLTEHVAKESRRTVSIVFAMPKVHPIGGESGGDGAAPAPEALRDVMSAYFDAMRAALERHGGTVEKFIGDAVMAVFGLPVRHEDDALRAIRAAADMQAALPALNEAFRRDRGLELENHIGVNTGEVIAGDASTGQRLVTGDAVNTAARLEQAAGPGEIVLGDLTYRLARGQLEIEFIPPLTLKGKAEPVPAYRLVRVGAPTEVQPADTTTTATPFVGREAEMGRLSEALGDAMTGRKARLVTLVGDAGVGKSRLIREFAARAAESTRVARGRCLPYGDGITFWPLAEVVREAAGILGDDTPEQAIARIRALCASDEQEAIVERVASAMNLTATPFPVPELMWGGRRLLEAIAGRQPLTMIIDDIHSAETTFLEFIDHLLENVDGASILLLCSARHEIAERHAEWLEAHDADTIRLEPLTESESGQIVEELLGTLEGSVRERITAVSEGNPLYVEQIVSMLIETGEIQRGMDGWVARGGSEAIKIPPTVEALVAARLDALDQEERAVVEPAAVIGLSFPMDAVDELVEAAIRDHLEAELAGLTGKQLVRRAPGDEVIYRFGHQIIRDTAYGGLLKRLRALLHERFVTWAERVNRERGRETEFEEILGYHLEQAYRYRTELGVVTEEDRGVGERAAQKLASAGRRANERGDGPAAVSLLRRAAALLPRESHFRLELLVDLGEATMNQGRFDEGRTILNEARATAGELGEPRLEVRGALLLAAVDQFQGTGTTAQALETARHAIDVLEAADDRAGLARAWRVVMTTELNQGHLEEASAAVEHVVGEARASGDQRLAARSAAAIAYVLLRGPTPVREAIEQCRDLIATVTTNRVTQAIVESTMAVLTAMDGSIDQARELYRHSQSVLTELAGGVDALAGSIDSSRVELLAGDPEGARRELVRDYDALTAIDETFFRSTIAGQLAGVLQLLGEPAEARRYADVAAAIGDDDDILTQVLWRIARARLAASAGDADEAVGLGQAAVELASRTTDGLLRAEALETLGDVFAALGLRESAEPPWREALQLFEAKGDVLSARALSERLSAVQTA